MEGGTNSRIITFYQNALHLTRVHCATFYHSALHYEEFEDVTTDVTPHVTDTLEPSSFFAWI